VAREGVSRPHPFGVRWDVVPHRGAVDLRGSAANARCVPGSRAPHEYWSAMREIVAASAATTVNEEGDLHPPWPANGVNSRHLPDDGVTSSRIHPG
jgi:hypothetical protein